MKHQDLSLFNLLNERFPDQLQPQLQQKATLVVLSHALEDEVIASRLSPVIFAAFQDMRYYRTEQARYDRLRANARALTLFGRNISPERTSYENDWFLVINEPRFKAVMACRQLEPLPDSDRPYLDRLAERNRSFVGFWSYEREVVDYACQVLAEHAGPEVGEMVRQTLDAPHLPLEQVRLVSQVSDRILHQMENTNLKAIAQIDHNQRLLADLQRQAGLLMQTDQAKQLAENERTSLHTELKRLYAELTRSQTIMTHAVIDKARLEQAIHTGAILLERVQQCLQNHNGADNLSAARETLYKLQETFNSVKLNEAR